MYILYQLLPTRQGKSSQDTALQQGGCKLCYDYTVLQYANFATQHRDMLHYAVYINNCPLATCPYTCIIQPGYSLCYSLRSCFDQPYSQQNAVDCALTTTTLQTLLSKTILPLILLAALLCSSLASLSILLRLLIVLICMLLTESLCRKLGLAQHRLF